MDNTELSFDKMNEAMAAFSDAMSKLAQAVTQAIQAFCDYVRQCLRMLFDVPVWKALVKLFYPIRPQGKLTPMSAAQVRAAMKRLPNTLQVRA